MNCRKAEQLIPLFVETDLEVEEMQQVREHIETCIACHDSAAEFQASQTWLHATALPAFDEAMLAGMRSAVMQQIAQPATRPPFVEWLQPIWSWRWAFVAATAMLVLVSSFVMTRRSTETNPIQIGATTKDATLPAAARTQREKPQRLALASQVFQPRLGRKKIAQDGVRANERNPAIDVDDQIIADSVASLETNDSFASIPGFDRFALPLASQAENVTPSLEKNTPEPEMLRMEFQTADPNIRINWLAPKEPARTTPITDTK